MKTTYTKEQNEWLLQNASKHTWERLCELFNAKFGTSKGFRGIKTHCRTTLHYCPFLKGCEKGQRTNSVPIGSENIVNGYVTVKVSDERRGRECKNHAANWKMKHVVVWEQHYGKVPKGCKVLFLDGDNRNFDIENLYMTSCRNQGRLADVCRYKSRDPKVMKCYGLMFDFEDVLCEIKQEMEE